MTEARDRIRQLSAEGLSQTAIAHRLNAERIPTPRGLAMWNHRQVAQHGWPDVWAAYMRSYRRERRTP
jgi:IS30 family transposase